MYEPHPQLKNPNPTDVVWRFMDFAKFASLLQGNLFFPRVDRLPDKYEGIVPKGNIKRASAYLKAEQLDRYIKMHHVLRSDFYVSCWHINGHESAAMWNLYSAAGQGIAIRTTAERLCQSFAKCSCSVLAGVVDYIDYETDEIPESNALFNFMYKRLSFKHRDVVEALLAKYEIQRTVNRSNLFDGPVW